MREVLSQKIQWFLTIAFDFRCSHRRCSIKKRIFRNFTTFTGKHLRQSLFFNKVAGLRPKTCNFIKKETLAQVFYCEFCEIFKNTFSYRTPPVAALVPDSLLMRRWIIPLIYRGFPIVSEACTESLLTLHKIHKLSPDSFQKPLVAA